MIRRHLDRDLVDRCQPKRRADDERQRQQHHDAIDAHQGAVRPERAKPLARIGKRAAQRALPERAKPERHGAEPGDQAGGVEAIAGEEERGGGGQGEGDDGQRPAHGQRLRRHLGVRAGRQPVLTSGEHHEQHKRHRIADQPGPRVLDARAQQDLGAKGHQERRRPAQRRQHRARRRADLSPLRNRLDRLERTTGLGRDGLSRQRERGQRIAAANQ